MTPLTRAFRKIPGSHPLLLNPLVSCPFRYVCDVPLIDLSLHLSVQMVLHLFRAGLEHAYLA
jgi:hypothetical protein